MQLTSQRQTWEFNLSPQEINKGAKAKLIHHNERLQFWRDKKEETIKKIRSDEGLKFDTSLADVVSNNYSGRTGAVQIPEELQSDLYECNTKIMEHEQKTREYFGWTQLLTPLEESPNVKSFPLRYDDYQYFFGGLHDVFWRTNP